MGRFNYLFVLALAIFVSGVGPCQKEKLTNEQALEALGEAALSNQAMSFIAGSVEISTNFTIGGAVEQAAEELQVFIESQLPCAQITLEGATLTVVYGVNPGECTYNGNEYFGTHTITVSSASIGNLVVDHEWTNFTNGILIVSGTAQVTWDSENGSRQIVHSLTWTRLADQKTGTGSGDRVQSALNGDILVGINVDGSREWITGEEDEWILDIDNVEMRWEDPVPQSGTYTLDTPFDIEVSLSFDRVDEDTIAVTIASADDSFTFDVSQAGNVSD